MRFVQRRPDAEHRGVFLALVCDVFAVGGAVSLVPVSPSIMCQPGVAAEFFRKHLPLIDIAGCPVDLAGYVEPVVSSKYHLAASLISPSAVSEPPPSAP